MGPFPRASRIGGKDDSHQTARSEADRLRGANRRTVVCDPSAAAAPLDEPHLGSTRRCGSNGGAVSRLADPSLQPIHEARCSRFSKGANSKNRSASFNTSTSIPGNPEKSGTRDLQERQMKRRHEFYLEEELSERLATVAAKPGSSKTAIMTDALKAYFDRRAGTELDERFRARMTSCRSSLAASSATSRS
jgi:hypothetical protein